MLKYLLRRLVTSAFLIVCVFIVTFFAIRLASGNPAAMSQGSTAQFHREFGTDKSNLEQFWSFLLGLPRGDLGTSFHYREPTFDMIKERLPNTLRLGGLSLLIVTVLSAVLGVASAVKRDSWFDHL